MKRVKGPFALLVDALRRWFGGLPGQKPPALFVAIGDDLYALWGLPRGDGGEVIWRLVRPPREEKGETAPVQYDVAATEFGPQCGCKGHLRHGERGPCKHIRALVEQRLIQDPWDTRWGLA